ncbi:thioredoxin domain-containing protein [Sphingobium sp. DEHP117]|uniref:thioredoxin domain-containing protein n=1 Tax=Sphingobium sp. DEHP117 TaxID=2993436 RepID=UPI0027D5DCAA|nr:thioredoxin domain-containing protein [Sphingobium sp. DEHP117]MDQ4420854.1 thioredoxin domain-containing protein [Sphingobium sp. DEHP117]
MTVTKPLAALGAALLLSLSLSACGDKKDAAAEGEKIAAGQDVPPPAGKQWSDVVADTPEMGVVMGNPNAPAKLVEYASYTCPHCRDFTAQAAEPLRKMVNSGRLSYEFRSFLRDPYDLTMALLAKCGGAEPFFPLTEQLFANQENFFTKAQALDPKAAEAALKQAPNQRFVTLAGMTGLVDFVKQRGIPEAQAKQCLADSKMADGLVAKAQEGAKQFEISGTPTFVLNGKVVEDTASWELLRTKLTEAGL